MACNSWLDHGSTRDPSDTYEATREDKKEMFRRAMDRTWFYLWDNGLIEIK